MSLLLLFNAFSGIVFCSVLSLSIHNILSVFSVFSAVNIIAFLKLSVFQAFLMFFVSGIFIALNTLDIVMFLIILNRFHNIYIPNDRLL